MTTRALPRSVFWAKFVAATTIVLSVAGTVELLLAGHLADSAQDLTDQWFGGLGLVAICLALTGGLIAVRRPGNRIGWLLLVPGLCYSLIQVASGITLVALGLLLFFHREWWLQVAVNRLLIDLGLAKP